MNALATPEAERPAHAPYGKACLNCVKSKTKCAGSDGEGKCERYVKSTISMKNVQVDEVHSSNS